MIDLADDSAMTRRDGVRVMSFHTGIWYIKYRDLAGPWVTPKIGVRRREIIIKTEFLFIFEYSPAPPLSERH